MAAPVWKTTAGSLGKINELENFSFQLEAEDADSTALTYSKIAGTLPPGIELTTAGVLQGVPSEVATRSLYNFVVRASDGTNIADRTFSLQVKGADDPSFTTAAGQLDLSDSTTGSNKWVSIPARDPNMAQCLGCDKEIESQGTDEPHCSDCLEIMGENFRASLENLI